MELSVIQDMVMEDRTVSADWNQ